MKHNYMENMKHDIRTYMDENEEWFYGMYAENQDRDEWLVAMEDALWCEDSVTGNGSGSYTFSREEAKKCVLDDFDIVSQAIDHFCIPAEEVGKRFIAEDWEWFDVAARCFILGSALYEIADELDRQNMEMNGQPYFKE